MGLEHWSSCLERVLSLPFKSCQVKHNFTLFKVFFFSSNQITKLTIYTNEIVETMTFQLLTTSAEFYLLLFFIVSHFSEVDHFMANQTGRQTKTYMCYTPGCTKVRQRSFNRSCNSWENAWYIGILSFFHLEWAGTSSFQLFEHRLDAGEAAHLPRYFSLVTSPTLVSSLRSWIYPKWKYQRHLFSLKNKNTLDSFKNQMEQNNWWKYKKLKKKKWKIKHTAKYSLG